MRRRAFIAGLGSAAAGPLAARAQQPEQMRRIGVLVASSEDESDIQARLDGFRQGIEKLGWSQGRNLRIDTRFAAGRADQYQVLAKELVALQPDVILAQSPPITEALQRESHAIPIVFVSVSDPIGAGFVASLARPGGNITGMMQYEAGITGKWLAMLKEISPRLARVALVGNAKTTAYDYFLGAAEVAAPPLAIELVPRRVETAADIERAIGAFRARRTVACSCCRIAPSLRIAISSSRLPPTTACRRSTRSVSLSRPAVLCPMGPTRSKYFGRPHPTSTASCAAQSPLTFRCGTDQVRNDPQPQDREGARH